MDPSIIIMFVAFALLMLWMSYSSRKAREKQSARRDETIRVGVSVMTTAGFYGTIVDIDGDAITLASPSGDETVWDRRAIAQEAQLPLAPSEETDDEGQETSLVESGAGEKEAPDDNASHQGESFGSSSDRPSSPFAY